MVIIFGIKTFTLYQIVLDESSETRRKEALSRQDQKSDRSDSKASIPEVEDKKEVVKEPPKRATEEVLEPPVEAKRPCVVEPVLEDDLSEISDDADEILNREVRSLYTSAIYHISSNMFVLMIMTIIVRITHTFIKIDVTCAISKITSTVFFCYISFFKKTWIFVLQQKLFRSF